MRALMFTPDGGLRLEQVPDPVPAPSQALVAVAAASINFGEVGFRDPAQPSEDVVGYDAAGVVSQPAADGSGPPAGTRVASFDWRGGWAELRAVETRDLAVVPDAVDIGVAAALPVAGVTALGALRRLGSVAGRRVLVTGAAGGVGRYAVQLAAQAGAHVVASVGSRERGAGLAELGADEVVVGLAGIEQPLYGMLDTVGGPQLAAALALMEPGGLVQWIGRAAREPFVLSVEAAETQPPWRLEQFHVAPPFGPDLAYLLQLVERGELDPQIGWRGSWEQATEAAAELLARRVAGKAVIDVVA